MNKNTLYNMNFYETVQMLANSSHIFDREFSEIGNGWTVVGKAAGAIRGIESVTLQHNGGESRAQVNLIKRIVPYHQLAGKKLTFSVEARVLQTTSDGKGGVLGAVNANGYSGGKFFERTEFTNPEWERISLNFTCPKEGKMKGLTICLRSVVTEESAAVVEFRHPSICFAGEHPLVEIRPMDTGAHAARDSERSAFFRAVQRRDKFCEHLRRLMHGFQIAEELLSDDEETHYILLNKHLGDIFRVLQYTAVICDYYSGDEPYHMAGEWGTLFPKGMCIKKLVVITTSVGAGLCKLFSNIDDVIVLPKESLYDLGVYSKSALCVHKNLHRDEEGVSGDRVGTQYKSTVFSIESYYWYWNVPIKMVNHKQIKQIIEKARRVSEDSIAAAVKILDQHRAVPEKTIILCPYAQSTSMIPHQYWKRAIHQLTEEGYQVFTNCAGNEQALAETAGLFVSVDTLVALGTLGCLVAGVQSGLIDTIHRIGKGIFNINIHVLIRPYDHKILIDRKIAVPTDRKANTFHLSVEEADFPRFSDLLLNQIDLIEGEQKGIHGGGAGDAAN